jgi:hypothetical protein
MLVITAQLSCTHSLRRGCSLRLKLASNHFLLCYSFLEQARTLCGACWSRYQGQIWLVQDQPGAEWEAPLILTGGFHSCFRLFHLPAVRHRVACLVSQCDPEQHAQEQCSYGLPHRLCKIITGHKDKELYSGTAAGTPPMASTSCTCRLKNSAKRE